MFAYFQQLAIPIGIAYPVKWVRRGLFLTAIAEQPNEILKCAMHLFIGYLDGATQFAQSCGGGDSSLPWGRNPDEDDRRFAYRCMMQAHRMMKPSQPKRSMNGRK